MATGKLTFGDSYHYKPDAEGPQSGFGSLLWSLIDPHDGFAFGLSGQEELGTAHCICFDFCELGSLLDSRF